MADYEDDGFWNDEPTRSFRDLFSTGSHRRMRQQPIEDPVDHRATDPTPTAAYDPWLDDDLDAVSFVTGSTPRQDPTYSYDTGSYDAGGYGKGGYDEDSYSKGYDDGSGYAWTLDDDDEHREIRAAAPLAPVHSGGRGPIDPLFKRIAMIAVAMALVLPVGLALRGNDKPTASLQATPATEQPVASSAATVVTTAGSLVATAAPPVDIAATTSTPATPNSPSSSAGRSPAGAGTQAAAVPALRNLVCGYSSYRVVKGDFWARIAKKAEVRLSDLLTVNQTTVDTPLFPGDKVCMPPNARSTSTTAAPTTAAPTPTEARTAEAAADSTAAETTTATTAAASTTSEATATTKAPAATDKATATTAKATTTTAAPTRTSTPAGTAAPKSYSRDQVIEIIREAWPDELEERAIQIAIRESSLQPGVRNWCCFGLFQIYFNAHKSWLAGHGVTAAEQLYDPHLNAKLAYILYQRAGGWGPWM